MRALFHLDSLLLLIVTSRVACFQPLPLFRHDLSHTFSLHASISDGDTVLVFGGTGGVGQLVTRRLLEQTRKLYPNLKVRVATRDIQRATDTLTSFSNSDTTFATPCDLVQIDTLTPTNPQQVQRTEEQLISALQNVSAIVISVGTTAFPTAKWKDGNTPQAIDLEAVSRIVQLADKISSQTVATTSNKPIFSWPFSPTRPAIPSLKRIVLVTSIGVQRTNVMPFVFLNLFGVLDAKRAGEEALIQGALTSQQRLGEGKSSRVGWDYVIVRPGRLVGGPYSNLDLAKLMQIDGGNDFGVNIQKGDTLLGDCKRITCADAVVQSLFNDKVKNIDFSIVSAPGNPWTEEEWNQALVKL